MPDVEQTSQGQQSPQAPQPQQQPGASQAQEAPPQPLQEGQTPSQPQPLQPPPSAQQVFQDSEGSQPAESPSAPWDPQTRSQADERIERSFSWFWLVGGFFFGVIAVIAAALFTMGRTPEERNRRIQLAAFGMIGGLVVEMLLLVALGGPDALMSLVSPEAAAPSSGSLF